MLSKLAFKNVKKSMKDFTIYFLTLTFGVCLFYVFNSIDSQQAMIALNSDQRNTMKLLVRVINLISVFVSVILGFLIIYANGFLIKRRKKELGIYLTLGMNRRSVSWILIKETFIIGIFSLVIGFACGLFLSQGLAIFTAKMFKVTMKEFTFVFSKSALLKTISYFGIIFVVVMIFNIITVCRVKLIDLIYGSKKNQKLRVKNIWVSVILFIISIVCLGFAYYFIIDNGMLEVNREFYESIMLGIIGTFLFFLSLAGFFLKVLQSNKKFYFRGLNMFVLRQINSKITTTFVSMTLICLMLLIAVGVLATGAGLANTMSSSMDSLTPFDASLMVFDFKHEYLPIKSDKNYVINQMKKDNIKLDDIVDKYKTLNICCLDNKVKEIIKYVKPSKVINKETLKRQGDEKLSFVSLSDYNDVMKMSGKKTISLKNNEFALSCNYDELIKPYEEFIEKDGVLRISNKEYKSINKLVDGSFYNTMMSDNMGTVVVPDNVLKNSKTIMQAVNIDLKGDDKKSQSLLESRINKVYKGNEQNKPFVNSITKQNVYDQSRGLSTVVSYIAIYIGVVFLITCSAIIALQQLSESSDNIERYKLLREIGTEEKDINKSLFTQILITFMVPLSLALVHSFVGIKVANSVIKFFGEFHALNGIIPAALAILVIYGGYMLATYFGSKSIIKGNN